MTVATVTTEYRIKANNKKEAEETLHSYLKRGVCSWIVKYND